MTLDELKSQVNEDLKIDITKLTNETATNPLMYTKYVHLLSDLTLELKVAEIELKRVSTQRWLYYSGKGSGIVSPVIYNASEIKKVMEGDEEIIKIERRIILLEMKKQIIDEAVKAFSQRGFSLANIIKWEMFKGGNICL